MNIQPLCGLCYLYTQLAGGGVTLLTAFFVFSPIDFSLSL